MRIKRLRSVLQHTTFLGTPQFVFSPSNTSRQGQINWILSPQTNTSPSPTFLPSRPVCQVQFYYLHQGRCLIVKQAQLAASNALQMPTYNAFITFCLVLVCT